MLFAGIVPQRQPRSRARRRKATLVRNRRWGRGEPFLHARAVLSAPHPRRTVVHRTKDACSKPKNTAFGDRASASSDAKKAMLAKFPGQAHGQGSRDRRSRRQAAGRTRRRARAAQCREGGRARRTRSGRGGGQADACRGGTRRSREPSRSTQGAQDVGAFGGAVAPRRASGRLHALTPARRTAANDAFEVSRLGGVFVSAVHPGA